MKQHFHPYLSYFNASKEFHRFRYQKLGIISLILNAILSSILFIYILIGRLSVNSSCFLMIFSKWSGISDAEYNPSANLKLLFYVVPDIFCFHMIFFYIFPCIVYAIDLIEQHIYRFSFNVFYLKSSLIAYKFQMFC